MDYLLFMFTRVWVWGHISALKVIFCCVLK